MVTKTIVDGNVYVTTGKVNTTTDTIEHNANECVEIFSAKIDYDYLNNIKDYTFKSSGSFDDDKPSKVIDLKRIRKVITVTGILDDESSLKAITKRDNLLHLAEFHGELTLVWGRGNYRTHFYPDYANEKWGVYVLKIRARNIGGIYGEMVAGDPQPETKHDIEIQFIVGRAPSATPP